MKKFFVLALSAIMVLAFDLVSMAATVTIGGELDFGKQWSEAGDSGHRGTLYYGHNPNEYCTFHQATGNSYSMAKITVTAQIADNVKAFVALKEENGAKFGNDESWVQFTEDYGTIKVGYFGYSQDQKDIIDDVIPDVKSGLSTSYSAKMTDQLTLNLAAANDGSSSSPPGYGWWKYGLSGKGLDYSIGLAYDSDNFGINGNYFKYAADDDASAFSLMGYYKLDALKFYTQYENNNYWEWATTYPDHYWFSDMGTGVQNFIIGVVYDSADVPLFVRAEYDLNDQHTGSNEWALRLAYKMTANVKFQYTMMRHNYFYSTDMTSFDNYNTNELLLIATF